jgi:hypothetical protein
LAQFDCRFCRDSAGFWALFALAQSWLGFAPAWAQAAARPGFALALFGVALVGSVVSGFFEHATVVKAQQQEFAAYKNASQQVGFSEATFKSAIAFGDTGGVQIGATTVDSAGNIYVTGGFSGTIALATTPATNLTATSSFDVFVAKFDANMNPLWARQANGASVDEMPDGTGDLRQDGGASIAVDASGNVYVGGLFVKKLRFKNANNTTHSTLTDVHKSGTFCLTDIRTALTNAFGYYRFADVAVRNYVLSVQTKRFEFTDNNRIINVQGEINNANFIAK